jgi:hypothetical protein
MHVGVVVVRAAERQQVDDPVGRGVECGGEVGKAQRQVPDVAALRAGVVDKDGPRLTQYINQ